MSQDAAQTLQSSLLFNHSCSKGLIFKAMYSSIQFEMVLFKVKYIHDWDAALGPWSVKSLYNSLNEMEMHQHGTVCHRSHVFPVPRQQPQGHQTSHQMRQNFIPLNVKNEGHHDSECQPSEEQGSFRPQG